MDYQREYIEKNSDLHNSDVSSKVSVINRLLPKIPIKIDSVVDVACGSGKILLEITKGLDIKKSMGIDISKNMIEVAKTNDLEKIVEWINDDVYQVQRSDFDLVLAVDILEHIEKDIVLLNHIKKLGRFVILKVPIEKNILNNLIKILSFGYVDEQKYTELKYGHIHHYSEKDIDKLIEGSNLRILFKEYVHLPKRSKLLWEILRIIFFPIWYVSRSFYLKFNGGFLVLLLS
ncbi:MAG: methyltransferase domain-containing protein [bacterium]|nr:methyltransferase domain-containing protein [bacterium]